MLTDKKKPYCNPEIWGGIECTINRVGDAYFDQLEYGNFYQDPPIESIVDLGIKKLRFPILWEKHQPALGQSIDWSWTEQQVISLYKNNIDVIAGLVHHGSGPAFTNMLDPNFPYLLADYARQVAEKFPWINYYTPVNEPLTTARFSGLYGLWYPHKKGNDKGFLKMLLNELKGVVLSMQEIRKINPVAKLVQTEDLGKTYSTPKLKYQATFENERRWLTYDILCGRLNPQHKLWKYFKRFEIPEEDLLFFQNNICEPDIFGFNHYVTSERYLDEKWRLYPPHTHGGNRRHKYADVEAVRVEVEEKTGIEVLLQEAWERYKKPIAVTEVHLHCHREEQIRWFKYVWESCKNLKNNGIDIRGVTAWAMFGSFGWNKLLTEPGGEYEPGVFDIRSGVPRPTALRNYIQQLTGKSSCYHPLSKEKGWWQRDCRYIYVPYVAKMKLPNNHNEKQPLLIIGKNGTLGRAFAKVCEQRMIPYQLLSRQDCDIADPHTIESAIDFYKPWAVINAAGYVRVDDAELEKEQCFRENQLGPINLAIACKKHGVKLVTFSSDLVFDGSKNAPYVESDAVNPLNIYGHSKAQCEEQLIQTNDSALIIRTSAFFGPWDQYNFVQSVMNHLNSQQVFTVAHDVFISPTYVPDLVHAALDLLIDDETGIWHLANKGAISWADFANETANMFGLDNSYIKAVPLAEMNYVATRPIYSVLGSEKGYLLPTLENALQRFFDEKKVNTLPVLD
jgi:dTDP-4-dehydrorhamnose reductase